MTKIRLKDVALLVEQAQLHRSKIDDFTPPDGHLAGLFKLLKEEDPKIRMVRGGTKEMELRWRIRRARQAILRKQIRAVK